MVYAIILIAIIIIIVAMQKGTTEMSKPSKVYTFYSEVAPDKVMKTIIRFAQNDGYKVTDFNEEKMQVVLSDNISLTSFGFFFPIYVSIEEEKTKIEIGIKSKAGQIGPIVNREHEKCYKGIESAIYAAT